MDSFEFNKYAMAILGTVFLVMGLSFVSDSLFHTETPSHNDDDIEVASNSGSSEPTGPLFEPITAMLASADPAAGEKVFKKCSGCHTVAEGGANGAGPALYGVVERTMGSIAEFGYSPELLAYGEGKTWTYEELNGFLWKPKKYIKGTKMGFGGLKKVQDRADVVAYLRTLSASPAPLPAQ